ncbi:MAG: DNA primase catalytic subunit PriS, partial [Halobacteria archaeon]|nr:DNA primase catalytic subunit PriS [Halobacteria archaeon]
FGDYYRSAEVQHPRRASHREWAFIPFEGGMVRHKSLLDLGSLDTWLADTKPRHVYYSSAIYSRPDVPNMGEKGWLGADLIFDLDADHLEGVSPDDPYPEMLEKCKQSLMVLLDFLENDLGFGDLEIAFSGGRGYHVHVHDEEVQNLDSQSRREIVDYVQGIGFQPELAFSGETVGGEHGRKSPVEVRKLNEGAWSKRIRDYILDFGDELTRIDEEEAVERLKGFENVGDKKARKILGVFRDKRDAIESGNLDVVGGLRGFWDALIEQAVSERHAETDEPVTTDTKRLIRLPGSLHGGTGLRVTSIERDDLSDFKPLEDAVVFSDHEVDVISDGSNEINVGGRTFNIVEGENNLPEYAAIFAILRTGVSLG